MFLLRSGNMGNILLRPVPEHCKLKPLYIANIAKFVTKFTRRKYIVASLRNPACLITNLTTCRGMLY